MRLFLTIFLFIPALLHAQVDSVFIRNNYTKSEHLVPMRDGVKLFTTVYTPKNTAQKHPMLLNRTPYSVGPYGDGQLKTNLGPSSLFVKANYIIVYQDVRGKYMSEGEFVDVRPHNPAKKGKQIDEASDTYDTVDWLLKNIKNNNGKVGVWGISYPGFYASMAAISGHPGIKAVSPQAPVTNWFLGDDFHHNGAFFQFDALSFYSSFGKKRPTPTTVSATGMTYPSPDAYDFYLKEQTLGNMNAHILKNDIPFWNDLMKHPNYDDFWQARDIRKYLVNVKPAVLTVGGFFDAEDCWGALETYKSIERNNPQNTNQLVMGPWFHGAWARGTGESFGDIKFGSATSTYYKENIEFPFFEFHLNNGPPVALPEASVFDIGAKRWRTFSEWPTKNAMKKTLYFGDNEQLAENKGSAKTPYSEYISDPNKPVPFQDGVSNRRSREYMIDDQRFAARRPDVLVFETEVLTGNVSMTGPIVANLWVSTTGTDADFVVKIIDVYPDSAQSYELNGKQVPIGGYQMLVRGEIMRGRYRDSMIEPSAFVPNQPTLVKLTLPDVMHTFKIGHKIMVQVQSSWFPLVDRNPQQFINIYEAKPEDFKKATHRMYTSSEYPSALEFDVLK